MPPRLKRSKPEFSATLFSDHRLEGTKVEGLPVRGISFIENIDEFISDVWEGDKVVLTPVDDNPHDATAVRVSVVVAYDDGDEIFEAGWLPKEINQNYRDEVKQGYQWQGQVSYVSEGVEDEEGNSILNPGLRITFTL